MQSAAALNPAIFRQRSLPPIKTHAYAAEFSSVIRPLLLNWLDQSGLGSLIILDCKAARALYRAMAIKDEYEVATIVNRILNFTSNHHKNSRWLRPKSPIIWPRHFLSWIKDKDGQPRKLTIWADG
jgi:hypothetical protein